MSKLTFKHPYEGLVYLARQNCAYFCNAPALQMFREALTVARTPAEKAYCEKEIAALEKCE